MTVDASAYQIRPTGLREQRIRCSHGAAGTPQVAAGSSSETL